MLRESKHSFTMQTKLCLDFHASFITGTSRLTLKLNYIGAVARALLELWHHMSMPYCNCGTTCPHPTATVVPHVHALLQLWYHMSTPYCNCGTTCPRPTATVVPHVHALLQLWYHMSTPYCNCGTTCPRPTATVAPHVNVV